MARETINGISVPIPGTGEPADFVGDLRQIATDLPASYLQKLTAKSSAIWKAPTSFGSAIQYAGYDATEDVTFWVSDIIPGLYLSSDLGSTLTTDKGLPSGVTSYTSIRRIQRFGALWVMQAVHAASGTTRVYSAPVVLGNTALTWTERYTMRTGASGIAGGIGVAADGSTLLLCEYSSTVDIPAVAGGVQILRTTDLSTWTPVYTAPVDVRHFHHVAEDPYNPGHWYCLVGDGTTIPLIRSTDDGLTWSVAVSSPEAQWDGVFLSFGPDFIYATGDVNFGTSAVGAFWRCRRTGPNAFEPELPQYGSPQAKAVVEPGRYTPKGGLAGITSGQNWVHVGVLDGAQFSLDDVGRTIMVKTNNAAGTRLVPSGTRIVDFVSPRLYLSEKATGTATDIVIAIDREERNYPYGLYGVYSPAHQAFFYHAHDGQGFDQTMAWRPSLWMCPDGTTDLIWLCNLVSGTRLLEVVGDYVLTGPQVKQIPTISEAHR